MFYKVDEYIYSKHDKYTFKEQHIIDGGRLVYCLVAVSGDIVHGLLQSAFENLTADEIDLAIKEYLKNRKRLVNFEYSNAKDLIKLTDYKAGK